MKKNTFFSGLVLAAMLSAATSQAQFLKKVRNGLDKASSSLNGSDNSSGGSSGGSPASGATKGSAGQVVFTSSWAPGFDAAKAKAIKEVKDGDSIWVYVKLNRPVEDLVQKVRFTDDAGNVVENWSMTLVVCEQGASSGYTSGYNNQQIFIKGGKKTPTGMEFNQGVVGHLKLAAGATEFSLCLSQYKRHLSSWAFVRTVGEGQAGVWANEVRFYGEDQSRPFAAGPLTASVNDGIPKYRKMWLAYKEIYDKGDVADSELPPLGKFNDAKVKAVITSAAKAKGITPTKIYFTVDSWAQYEDEYARTYRKVYAAIMYKKDGKCFYSMAEVIANLVLGEWAAPRANIYGESNLECSKM